MKTIFSSLMLMFCLIIVGCRSTPVNISGVSKQADLDDYVGRTIVFTGRYMPTKELTISNGKVLIEVHRFGSVPMDKDTMVTGVLKKDVIPPMPQQDSMIQLIPCRSSLFHPMNISLDRSDLSENSS